MAITVAELFATLGLDASGLDQGLAQSKATIGGFASDTSLSISNLQKEWDKSMAIMGKSTNALEVALKDLGVTIVSSQQERAAGIQLLIEQTLKLQATQEKQAQIEKDAAVRQREISDQQNSAAQEALRVEKQIADQREAVDRDSRARAKELLDQQLGDYAVAERAERAAAEASANAERNRTNAAVEAANQIRQARSEEIRQLRLTAQTMSDVGRVGLVIFTPIVAAEVLAAKSFADFDAALTHSLSILGDVDKKLREDLAAAAVELSTKFAFSAKDIASSIYDIGSAGYSAEQTLSVLPTVTKFAAAGFFDMKTAAETLTSTQAALGLRSTDTAQNLLNMARVGDVLVKADTLAAGTTRQFAEALFNAASSARQLHIPLEDTVAALGIFSKQGIQGREAGTQLGIVLRDLSQKAITNSDAFRKMGIEVYNTDGSFRRLPDIIKQLEIHFDGLSDKQIRYDLLQLGLQQRSLRFTLALLGNSDAMAKLSDELDKAGNTMSQVATKNLDTFEKQMELLHNRVTAVAIILGGPMVDALKVVLNALTPAGETVEQFAKDFDSWNPALKAAISGLALAVTGLGEFGSGALVAGSYALRAAADLKALEISLASVKAAAAIGGAWIFSAIPLVGTFWYFLTTDSGWDTLQKRMGDFIAAMVKIGAIKAIDAAVSVGGLVNTTPTVAAKNIESPTGEYGSRKARQEFLDMQTRIAKSYSAITDATEEWTVADENALATADKRFNVAKSNLDEINKQFEVEKKAHDLGIRSDAEYAAAYANYKKQMRDANNLLNHDENEAAKSRKFNAEQYDKDVKANEKTFTEFVKVEKEWQTQEQNALIIGDNSTRKATEAWGKYDEAARKANGIASDLRQTYYETGVIITDLKDRLPEPIYKLYDATVRARADLRGMGEEIDGIGEGLPKRIALMMDLFKQMDAGVNVSTKELESAVILTERDLKRLAEVNPEAAIKVWDVLIKRIQILGHESGLAYDLSIIILKQKIAEGIQQGKNVDDLIKKLGEEEAAYQRLIDKLTQLGELHNKIMADFQKVWADLATAMTSNLGDWDKWKDGVAGVFEKLGQSLLHTFVDTIFKAIGNELEAKTHLFEKLADVATKAAGKILTALHIGGGTSAVGDIADAAGVNGKIITDTLGGITSTGAGSVPGKGGVPTGSASGGGGSGSAASSILGTVSSVAGIAGAVASIASGITQGIQMASLLSDTGKIEVNTRAAMQQLRDGIQPRLDTYLPKLINLVDIWTELTQIRSVLWRGVINVHPVNSGSDGTVKTDSQPDFRWADISANGNGPAAILDTAPEKLAAVNLLENTGVTEDNTAAVLDLAKGVVKNTDEIGNLINAEQFAADIAIDSANKNAVALSGFSRDQIEAFGALRQALIDGTGPQGGTTEQIIDPLTRAIQQLGAPPGEESAIKASLINELEGGPGSTRAVRGLGAPEPGSQDFLDLQFLKGQITADEYKKQVADQKLQVAMQAVADGIASIKPVVSPYVSYSLPIAPQVGGGTAALPPFYTADQIKSATDAYKTSIDSLIENNLSLAASQKALYDQQIAALGLGSKGAGVSIDQARGTIDQAAADLKAGKISTSDYNAIVNGFGQKPLPVTHASSADYTGYSAAQAAALQMRMLASNAPPPPPLSSSFPGFMTPPGGGLIPGPWLGGSGPGGGTVPVNITVQPDGDLMARVLMTGLRNRGVSLV